MKAFVAVAYLAAVLSLRGAEPVTVPNAASPNGAFAIRLSHDRATESDKPILDAPDVQIVAIATNKVLVAFPYAADPNSDHQPLRTNIRAYWNADGTAVALSFSERFYTHLLVYRLQGTLAEPEAFSPVTLPDTMPVIQAMIPRFQGWLSRNTIQFSAGTGALITPLADGDPNIMAVYSFTVDITDPKTPVIKRVELRTAD
jgi:hypothetical protein